MPLTTPEGVEIGKLKLNDVVYVRVMEGKTKNDIKAELRVRPRRCKAPRSYWRTRPAASIPGVSAHSWSPKNYDGGGSW